ncbi:MAG: DMT family transporter [Bacteroidia bacterium]|nr:DMT family transporter [Bacteroidia bacterium]
MGSATIGYVAAIVTIISWTIGTFAFTNASRLAPPASVNRVRLLYAWIVLSFLVCYMNQISVTELFSRVNVLQYCWFGISGFIGLTLGDYFAFTAFKILGGRRASLFTCFAPGAALLTGMLLIDEHLSATGILGMLVSLAGIVMLAISRTEQSAVITDGHGNFYKGILFAALGAICQGVGLVLAKKGFQTAGNSINPVHASWIRMLSASFFVYVIGAFNVNLIHEFKSITFNKKTLKPILLGTLFGPVIGVSFSLLSATHIEASVAQTLFSLLPVSVLLASVLFYKEKVLLRSYLAVLVSIIGVMILVWRNVFE